MIVDAVRNMGRYNIPWKEKILEFLSTLDTRVFEQPEIEIKGRELFVRPSRYRTKIPQEGKFETHCVYMDLQYVVEGAEIMETAPGDVLEILTAYDVERDYQFFSAKEGMSRVLVRAGEFAVFFPGEAHRPCCSPDSGARDVRKLVFKIRVGEILQ